jgi:hypothetical protein
VNTEKNSPERSLLAALDLIGTYATVLQFIELPLPVKNYADQVRSGPGDEKANRAAILIMSTVVPFLVLAIGGIFIFNASFLDILHIAEFFAAFFVLMFLLSTRYVRRVFMPLGLRVLTLDVIIKLIVQNHIKKRLDVLRRLYIFTAVKLPEDSEFRGAFMERADACEKLAAPLVGFRAIIYLSAPPLVATGISQLKINWPQVISSAPDWIFAVVLLYLLYLALVCFSRKRQIFLGAGWLPVGSKSNVYSVENIAYDSINGNKPKEFPLDIFFGGISSLWLPALKFVDIYHEHHGFGKASYDAGDYFAIIVWGLIVAYILICCAASWRRRIQVGTV